MRSPDRALIERSITLSLYLLFIDYQKAFDSLKAWSKLNDMNQTKTDSTEYVPNQEPHTSLKKQRIYCGGIFYSGASTLIHKAHNSDGEPI